MPNTTKVLYDPFDSPPQFCELMLCNMGFKGAPITFQIAIGQNHQKLMASVNAFNNIFCHSNSNLQEIF